MLKMWCKNSSRALILAVTLLGLALPALSSTPTNLTAVDLKSDVPLAQPNGQSMTLTTRSQLVPSGAKTEAQITSLELAADNRTLVLFAGGVSAVLGTLSKPSTLDGSAVIGAKGQSVAHVRLVSNDWHTSGVVTSSAMCSDNQTPKDQVGITHETAGNYEIDFDGGQGSLSFDVPTSHSEHSVSSACP